MFKHVKVFLIFLVLICSKYVYGENIIDKNNYTTVKIYYMPMDTMTGRKLSPSDLRKSSDEDLYVAIGSQSATQKFIEIINKLNFSKKNDNYKCDARGVIDLIGKDYSIYSLCFQYGYIVTEDNKYEAKLPDDFLDKINPFRLE